MLGCTISPLSLFKWVQVKKKNTQAPHHLGDDCVRNRVVGARGSARVGGVRKFLVVASELSL